MDGMSTLPEYERPRSSGRSDIISTQFGSTLLLYRGLRANIGQEFLLRVKRADQPEIYVGRRYGEFAKLHKRLRTELPGKVLAPLPRKNKSSTSTNFLGMGGGDDASSISSVSTQGDSNSLKVFMGKPHRRSASAQSNRSPASGSPINSVELNRDIITLYREDQRVSLRAFLRTFLQNQQIAKSKAMQEFLTRSPVKLNEEELVDIQRRKDMDDKRIEEQRKFYEIARERARELDVYMEKFRRDIIESSK